MLQRRILNSLGIFLDTVDLAFDNTTDNITTLAFNTYAVQIQEVDPNNFAGQTFAVNLGSVEQAMNISGAIAQEALVTLDGVSVNDNRRKRQSTNRDVENATASVQLTSDIFDNCVTNESSEVSIVVSQRLSYSVFVSDILFQTENESSIAVGSIVVAVRLRCQLANETMLSMPVRSTFQVAEMVCLTVRYYVFIYMHIMHMLHLYRMGLLIAAVQFTTLKVCSALCCEFAAHLKGKTKALMISP